MITRCVSIAMTLMGLALTLSPSNGTVVESSLFAETDAECNKESPLTITRLVWIVPRLHGEQKYSAPNASGRDPNDSGGYLASGEANQCACSECQGLTWGDSWASYSLACGKYLGVNSFKSSYFPEGYIRKDLIIIIPAWALIALFDEVLVLASKWYHGKYNAMQAMQIAEKDQVDLGGSLRPPKISKAGTIAAGVIGGAVALAIVAGVAYYMLRMRNRGVGVWDTSKVGESSPDGTP
ncbi:hypothetical protein DFP72DRAFT_861317 [Ephemerocybe angulata]|uniref:Uncharacterized protein n=1 Tax=Ephemerocybe angulata TaxID=980116 RepID=A0A8H6H8L4_9AGAR|nr:hypothetical protein DFP72DRAFT_861317 [Tulosesus angulatus]